MTEIRELMNLPGVNDLRLAVRAKFIAALLAEERGDHVEAERKLAEAIAAETGSPR